MKPSKPPTQAQIIQRQNFGKISSFLSHIRPLIDKGYFKKGNPLSALNRAVKTNLKWAVVNSGGIKRIDYTQITFSQGNLQFPPNMEAITEIGQTVLFSWQYHNHNYLWGPADDRCTVLIYNETKNAFAYQIDAAPRSQSQYKFVLPPSFTGDRVYAYISFNSASEQNLCSNSYFIGCLTII